MVVVLINRFCGRVRINLLDGQREYFISALTLKRRIRDCLAALGCLDVLD